MAFNFDKFESEFKQKRLFQSVAQLFGALRDPADQNARLLGVEPMILSHSSWNSSELAQMSQSQSSILS